MCVSSLIKYTRKYKNPGEFVVSDLEYVLKDDERNEQ